MELSSLFGVDVRRFQERGAFDPVKRNPCQYIATRFADPGRGGLSTWQFRDFAQRYVDMPLLEVLLRMAVAVHRICARRFALRITIRPASLRRIALVCKMLRHMDFEDSSTN
ncbi:hypothetical protein BH10PSE12_BH10PSE12_37210 [soil metagenome]